MSYADLFYKVFKKGCIFSEAKLLALTFGIYLFLEFIDKIKPEVLILSYNQLY